jgi:hypothetical protein
MTDVPYSAVPAADRRAGDRRAEGQYDKALRILLWVAGAIAVVLFAGLMMQLVTEPGGTNSYANLADAFLHGRLDVAACFDIDCAVFDGRTYVVFPPAPAVLAMPFVAVFGTSFAGFIAFATILSAASLALWWRILRSFAVERSTAIWILLALAVGTPLYFVTIRGDGVWFLAQVTAFLFSSLAVWAVVERKSLTLVGIFMGVAFLSRQMTILLVPFLYALWLRPDEKLFAFDRERIMAIVKVALPILGAIVVYMAYNYARFGSPLDTGYDYIATSLADRTIITERAEGLGLFSPDYFLFNVFYFFVQGFHVDFVGTYQTTLGGMDRFGTSLLAASPFVLLLVFAPLRRPLVIGGLCVLAMTLPMMIYHSNGYSQFNVQRYVLDWMPVLLVALAFTVKRQLLPPFAVLVTWAAGLTAVTSAVAFIGTAA